MIACHIEPKGQLEPEGEGLWRSTGADPQFRLTRPGGGRLFRFRLTGGWVRLRLDLEPVGTTKLVPLLYVDDGSGFREDAALRLEWREDGGVDDLIRLPRRVRGLRLDPLAASGRFRLSRASLEPLSGPRAAFEIARRLLRPLPDHERRPAALIPNLARLALSRPPAALWRAFWDSARPRRAAASYAAWIERVERPALPSPEAMREAIEGFAIRPRISIVMPVYNTPAPYLAAALASIRAQSYPDWELCLCDDASTAPHIAPMLARLAAEEPRVRLHTREKNGGIVAASNDALALATGDWLTLIDHDDTIPPHALFALVAALNDAPETDFVYSDEDKITVDGERYEPFFKPDWSPETLEACMYTAHLALYRMDIVARIGGFRAECEGAQDYDFVLRYTEHARHVRHVPQVLYHWRAIPGSTAQAMDNKGYVVAAAVRALEDRARRTGGLDVVRPTAFAGSFHLRRVLKERPLVSIVIPTAGRDSVVRGKTVDLLAACLASIRDTSTYESIEIVAVDNGDLRPGTKAALARHGARAVTWDRPEFNVAAKMNLGARHATGTVLVFLNDDVEVITPDWIEAMLALLLIPGVGAVGAKLLFETGELQHVGVSVIDATPDHPRRTYPREDPGHFFSTAGNRNYLAVTGACVMVRRADFEAVGGFDERFAVNYNDVDLCLRLYERGLRSVYCAEAQLYHYESRNRARTVDPAEHAAFRARWAKKLPRDPYYGEWFEALPPTFELDPARF
ncbi:glycosyltransferase family 2 protein [Methylorubrum salsuginis]|uniref:Glycosyltransferase, GT2 family n=1 Tax=Methylorubrum salsuginis TaxID=414703 RepID=A0A1I3YDH9_9HYPH|nr:glycosyltransferase family 2 protein [Methylorubrum salsuginis]SFK29997.1 Glycosyltransferase, GT2 family [Methylorubrum salsuginis]